MLQVLEMASVMGSGVMGEAVGVVSKAATVLHLLKQYTEPLAVEHVL